MLKQYIKELEAMDIEQFVAEEDNIIKRKITPKEKVIKPKTKRSKTIVGA